MNKEFMETLRKSKVNRLTTVKALPLAFYPGSINTQLEHSNKVILPQSVLDLLIKKYGDEIQYPIV